MENESIPMRFKITQILNNFEPKGTIYFLSDFLHSIRSAFDLRDFFFEPLFYPRRQMELFLSCVPCVPCRMRSSSNLHKLVLVICADFRKQYMKRGAVLPGHQFCVFCNVLEAIVVAALYERTNSQAMARMNFVIKRNLPNVRHLLSRVIYSTRLRTGAASCWE